MPAKTRVIVTRIKDDNTSALQEQVAEELTEYDENGVAVFKANLLWGTHDGANKVGTGEHPDKVFTPFFPGPGGSRSCIFTFLPTPKDGAAAEPAVSPVPPTQMPGLMEVFDPERPGMHRTDTIDYVFLLSGRLTWSSRTAASRWSRATSSCSGAPGTPGTTTATSPPPW
jgi:hypothetical protein